MAQSRFSLSWESHQQNICNGLSSLQQNSEFVDMTLAADGYLVKVHQVIIALASPYFKELIATAQCPHPVIFLNKISYNTLSSILEYIYTGEVLVSMEDLNELVEAGKELHIKGLEDMKIHQTISSVKNSSNNQGSYIEESTMEDDTLNDDICYFEIAAEPTDENGKFNIYSSNSFSEQTNQTEQMDQQLEGEYLDNRLQEDELPVKKEINESKLPRQSIVNNEAVLNSNLTTMQYTVSNQGSLQMILNRFMYYLKHTNRDGSRQWRCVDYLSATRCPAHVVTRDDIVLQRIQSHMHSFHDQRILKKVRERAIFGAIRDAEAEGKTKKSNKLAGQNQAA